MHTDKWDIVGKILVPLSIYKKKRERERDREDKITKRNRKKLTVEAGK